MALTSIDLCSRALVKVGSEPISSFGDGTVEARVAGSLYGLVRDAMLSFHPWNFAIVQQVLPRLASSPNVDFGHAFQLPADCLRVLSAGAGHSSQGIRYRVIGDQLHAGSDSVVVTYVSQAAEALFPPYFSLAMVARLAAEFCIPLTDSTSRWKALQDRAEEELRRAKLCDALEDTPQGIDAFNLVAERF